MTRPIARTGEVSYDGFMFPSPLRLRVQDRPVYDDAERVVKYRVYNLHLEVVLTAEDFDTSAYGTPVLSAGDPVDKTGSDAMRILRKKLTEPGKRLIFKQQGLGADLDVDYTKAVEFGPKPRMLLWEPVGSSQAVRIVWECEVAVAECSSGIITVGVSPVLQSVCDAEFGISDEGLSQRTVTGILEVNSKRSRDGSYATLLADTYRSLLALPIPLNFRRSQTYSLSTDGRTLRFRITDSEIPSPNPFYPHVVRCEATQRVSGAQMQWTRRLDISARITVAPNALRQIAWYAFIAIIKKRFAIWKELNPGSDKSPTGSYIPHQYRKATSTAFICRDFDYEEEIFGYTMTFRASFEIGCSLADIFRATAAWVPVEGNWPAWQTSMLAGPFDPRGSAQLKGPDQQKLYQICAGLPAPTSIVSKLPPNPERPTPTSDSQTIFSPPPPARSWLRYYVRLTIVRDGNVIRSRRIGDCDATYDTDLNQTGDDIDMSTAEAKNVKGGEVQLRGPSTYSLRLAGLALRVAHTITSSDLVNVLSIDGDDPVLVYQRQNLPDPNAPIPAVHNTFKATWYREYALTGANAKIKLESKPRGV